jgi:hypothetical protein
MGDTLIGRQNPLLRSSGYSVDIVLIIVGRGPPDHSQILLWRPFGGDLPRSGAHGQKAAPLRCTAITAN